MSSRTRALELAIENCGGAPIADKDRIVGDAEAFFAFFSKDSQSDVIKGFVVRLSGEDLGGYLEERAKHHGTKADHYHANVKALIERGEVLNTNTNNPVYSQQQSEQNHRQREGYFKFWAQHIVRDKTYELSDGDIARFEILESVNAAFR